MIITRIAFKSNIFIKNISLLWFQILQDTLHDSNNSLKGHFEEDIPITTSLTAGEIGKLLPRVNQQTEVVVHQFCESLR